MKQILASFLIAPLLTLPALAGAPVKLKSTVTVSSATLSLADLVEGQVLPATPLFAAPAPGESGIISSERVISALKRIGVTLSDKAPVSIMITRTGRVIDQGTLKRALTQALAEARHVPASNITVMEEALPKTLTVEQDSRAPLEVASLILDQTGKSYTADLIVADSTTLSQRRVSVSGRYDAFGECAKLARAGKKGDVLTANDLITERCALVGTSQANAPRTALIGMALIDDLAVGTSIDPSKLTKPILVEKGSSVTLTYAAGGLRLLLRGRAMEQGALGDTISVTHPQTKRTIDALVTGQGAASVNSLFPGKLASIDLPNTQQVKP
ncbi:MAG: flagellar basal body P-ring formation chaperone FlgA [Alphaproteobacteria bacterium]